MHSYWDAASNPDGAPSDEKLELLKAGPWCYRDEAGEDTIECPSKADRTQRAGIWENKVRTGYNPHHAHTRLTLLRSNPIVCTQRWRRDDRYAQPLPLVRARDQKAHDSPLHLHTDSTAAATSSARAWFPTSPASSQRKTAAKCLKKGMKRATSNVVRTPSSQLGALRSPTCLPQLRVQTDPHLLSLPLPSTDVCDAYCSNAAARSIKNIWACSFGLPTLGITAATQVSDAGLDIVGRHGANRPAGRPPTPESSFVEEYAILIQNDVASPRAPRNSISCRKDHREQTFGHYVTALDGKGRSKLREGFHVSCDTDTDCFSRCGIHPVNGYSYTCTHHLRLYDYQGVNESFPDGRVLQRPNHTPFTHKQLTPARSTYRSYYISEHDQYDIHNTSTGVCTDVRMDYMHTGCESRAGAAAMFGV